MCRDGEPSIGLSRRDKSWVLEIRWLEKTFPMVGRMGTQGQFGAERRQRLD